VKSISDKTAIATWDASVNGSNFRGFWIISLRNYNKAIKKKVCSRKWNKSTIKAREVRTLLEMI